jgi:two-component system sensor histidine kinase BaeS
MPHRDFRKRERPSWWPANEPWPPQRPFRRHPFFRRIGCVFAFFNVVGWALSIFIVISLARALGWVTFGGETPPVQIPAIAGMMIAAVMTIVFVGWGLRRVFTPLDDLVEAADRVADGDYSVRVREHGSRAMGSLARAFNKMASRLDETQSNRRDLLADVTHEMRTPLTVIQGNLEGMIDGVYPADAKNLRALVDETTVLARLIEDLRTLALAESGALRLTKEPTDIEALIRDVTAAFQAQARAQSVEVIADAAANLPPLNLDPGRMRQVLTNLLTNALRYAPVFDRFYRSTDSGGMGLGLAIAKHLVEAHGGSIAVRSTPGQGTTMQILLPVKE